MRDDDRICDLPGLHDLLHSPVYCALFSRGGIYFFLLVLLAAAATVLSFTRHKGMAVLLAGVVGLVALVSWCRDILVAPVWTRSNLVWFVLPEVCFSLAAFFNWLVQRPRSIGSADEQMNSVFWASDRLAVPFNRTDRTNWAEAEHSGMPTIHTFVCRRLNFMQLICGRAAKA
jgi:hypothetical protein